MRDSLVEPIITYALQVATLELIVSAPSRQRLSAADRALTRYEDFPTDIKAIDIRQAADSSSYSMTLRASDGDLNLHLYPEPRIVTLGLSDESLDELLVYSESVKHAELGSDAYAH